MYLCTLYYFIDRYFIVYITIQFIRDNLLLTHKINIQILMVGTYVRVNKYFYNSKNCIYLEIVSSIIIDKTLSVYLLTNTIEPNFERKLFFS